MPTPRRDAPGSSREGTSGLRGRRAPTGAVGELVTQRVGEMTEQEWLESGDPQAMLAFLQQKGGVSDRQWRLFAVACCRRTWHLLTDERSRTAVEVAERFADGRATQQELDAAATAAKAVPASAAAGAARSAARSAARVAAWFSAWGAVTAMGRATEAAVQAAIAADVFGNPWRAKPDVDPGILAWNAAVVRIATSIYEQRVLPAGTFEAGKMAILADALEEAGCHDPEMLRHCRHDGLVHVRGCWLIDLLLKKE